MVTQLQQYLMAIANKEMAFKHLETLGIFAKQHPEYPELYQFSYDQIESASNKLHPMVIESRGIILNSLDLWNPVARPFDRFFNYGETGAAEIDWKTARVQEKLDGSLMIMYWYGGKWNVATRNSPNASGTVGSNPFTFAELFFDIANKQGIFEESIQLQKLYTYLFELTSSYNRVVVNHQESKLSLIGVRDNLSGQEYPFDEFPAIMAFNPVKSFPLTSFDEIIEASKNLDPIQQEGYVVWDGKNRNKVKCPSYVALHHLVDGFSVRRVIELIKNGESSELMAYYPDYKQLFEDTEKKINSLSDWYDLAYASIIDNFRYREAEQIENNSKELGYTRKDFALAAQQASKYSSPFFALADQKVKSSKEFFLNLPTVKLEELIGQYT